MKTLGIAVGALACAAATSAFAQSPPLGTVNTPPASSEAADVLTAPVRAPAKAFELGVEAGYTQGFGSVVGDPRVGAGPGGTLGVSLGYRVDPHWSVGWGGQLQGYGSSGAQANGATLRGVTSEVRGAYHLAPYRRFDPYVSLGAGYRLFVDSPAGNAPSTLWHGLEVGKAEVGLDVRASEGVAISPVLGVDLNLFPWRAGGGPWTAPPSPSGLNTFVFAGIQGRFDVGGTRESRPAP
jgi:outer membrane protein W